MKRLVTTLFLALSVLALATTASAATILPSGATWEYTFANPTGLSTWNTTTGGWDTGPAPFGNNTIGSGYDPLFNYGTLWLADGTDGDDLWVRTSIDLTAYDLSTVRWNLGVDNGFKLYANGIQVGAGNAEGYTWRWEYSGDFGSALQSGVNVIAVALEDHGGRTAFDMEVVGTPVPEPGTLLLLGSGLATVLARRRRRQ